ncbi:aminodeoxychorismate synthase component 1 [Salinivibrio sp. EAGSL]|uniref:aminodeoxychorismate synthase component 1 n=1 Tax=Salinivibrio sp. EAGSL TaxID=2738468 RepID=UPI00158E92E7|nr:aminodeoxychorismate synthase component 1 [Salinivibrio sp. EAGSL]NUY55224.1 aminodeoxychorismate synthase component 1 [Salinivibrio sp. EAGSL]
MTLTTTPIDYTPDLAVTLFDRIAHQPWAMLLHSATRTHPDSRFDILVADPVATITARYNQVTTYYADGTTTTHTQDPFHWVADLQAKLLPTADPIAPWPFIGGALGYFGYDLGRWVEVLPALAKDELEVPDMAVGLYDWAVVIDHHQRQAVVIAPNSQQRWQWLTEQHAPTSPVPFSLTGPWQANMTAQQYGQKFDTVQAYLHAGDCYQINLAQRFSAPYQGNEWHAYRKLAANNGAPFSGFIRLQDSALLSVSPERFLSVHDKQIETKPIKGTRPRDPDPQKDAQRAQALKSAEKDRAENLMIVDLLRNDIGRIASPGSVSVPKLFDIESFPAVHHMVSTVTGRLPDDKTALDLLRAAFPGGSITGAPKVRAMEIIEELEPHRRHVYCGSFAYISRCGRMDTSITIRTLVGHQGQLHVWAGGGLVADSQADAEYQETLDKVSRILPVLAEDEALSAPIQD